MINLLIKNVKIVDPAKNEKTADVQLPVADVLIHEGKITKIGSGLNASGEKTLDGTGKCLMPGFVDLHTHFREPGFEAKETIVTGAHAGLKGGYVASVSMPNTFPPCDHQGVIDNIIRKAKEVPYYIFPSGTISKGREGKELSEMADLKNAGIVAVTDDGDWVGDALLMRRAMEYASMLDLIVMSHCEDRRLSAGGVMNEGLTSTRLGLKGITAASEEIAVARDIELARLTGAHLHLCHLSTARSVELLARAKKEGLRVTAEVTPHHIGVSEEIIEGYNTNAKMYPPLRTNQDIAVLKQALKDGLIDCIATDHAPHTPEDKMCEFDVAPFGVIGLETAFGIVMSELYHAGGWTLGAIAAIMSRNPAVILKKEERFGLIREGIEANLALVDPSLEWTVTSEELRSKSTNSCFIKRKLKGKVLATVCAGQLWEF
ncbi:MAG: dihydroorotase [Candidatus Omnitrophica bacterium]|nr:dihydroorotase [Candidatus Omnitrophota bacterium]